MKLKNRTKYISQSPEETITFAREFAKTLKPGSAVAFSGDLGSGKTTFIKGIALGLGLKNPDEVKSPTFALMHIYPTKIPLYHFDLYRLESLKEIETIGFEEFITDPKVISCIEWAEKAAKLLPDETFYIQIELSGENSRKIEIKGGKT